MDALSDVVYPVGVVAVTIAVAPELPVSWATEWSVPPEIVTEGVIVPPNALSGTVTGVAPAARSCICTKDPVVSSWAM